MSDLTEDRDAQRTSERPRPISAPPPDFDDGPGGETKQTPKEELARWRRMAARGADRAVVSAAEVGYQTLQDQEATREALRASEPSEVTRALASPTEEPPRRRVSAPPIAPPPAPLPRIEPPTRELELASDLLALSRREPTGPTAVHASPKAPPSAPTLPAISLPPRAAPPRPALWPVAGSLPPDVPSLPTPAIGVSLPPGVSVSSPPRARSFRPIWIAALVIAAALAGAGALLLWPRQDPFAAPLAATPPLTAPPVAPLASSPPVAGPPVTAPPVTALVSPSVAVPIVVAPPAAPIVAAPTAAPIVAAPIVAPAASPTPAAGAPAAVAPAPITPSEAPATSEALVAAGDEALERRDFGEALALYQRAIELDGHDPYAFAGAARASLALSRPADAVRFAERAVANRQRRAMFRVLLGDAHRANGSMERAREAWSRALELDPDDAEARARLAE